MDPFSAVAGAIAVVQIADRIMVLCKEYITGVKDAPIELKAISIEVGSVKCVVELIESLDPSRGVNHNVEILEKLQTPLEGCKEALTSLEKMLSPQYASSVKGKRKRLALSLEGLMWPFQREKAMKLLEEIGRHKSTMSLGLTTDAVQDLKQIKRKVEEIQNTTNDAEMDKILDWLATTDPSQNHNNACRLHEEHTGQWLTNSPEYASWKDGNQRFLWVHGIPGAGKTVLFSYIAQDIAKFCEPNEGSASVYYYCYHARNQDETTHFLRWVINQLCREIEGIPPGVRKMFKKGGHPTTSDLLSVLSAVVENFTRVYVTIDALDESKDREWILEVLGNIVGDERFNRIQLLATSREELDIERVLSTITKELSLSNPYVDADIRKYIESYLRRDPKLSKWPEVLRFEIEEALVKGAKGMFRWAFCQLDILKRLATERDIRSALTQLPKTLDETYERILYSIPSEQRDIARRTLTLIASGQHLTLDGLSDLLAVDPTPSNPSFDRRNRPLDLQAPIEACTCLLTHDVETDLLTLPHYTVKEYLMSRRICSGPANCYHLTEDSINLLTASCFIVYILFVNYYSDENYSTGWLYGTALAWPSLVRSLASDSAMETITPLVIQALDPTSAHFDPWARSNAYANDGTGWYGNIPGKQGLEECVTLAYLVTLELPEISKSFIKSQRHKIYFETLLISRDVREGSCCLQLFGSEGTLLRIVNGFDTGFQRLNLLQIAAREFSTQSIELFIGEGGCVNACSDFGFDLLSTALSFRGSTEWRTEELSWDISLEFVDFLVAHHVNVRRTDYTMTPLQAIIERIGQYDALDTCQLDIIHQIICKLIRAGANVNGVGCDSSNTNRIRLTCRHYFEQCAMSGCKCFPREEEERFTALALHGRGESNFYSTPLRILYDTKASNDEYADEMTKRGFKILEELLLSYGAKSLHLFPIKGLPGYVAEDMEEWETFNGARRVPDIRY